ncbi:carbohydrate-binding protein [Pseudogemmobacter bohemicus]|uniref:carbohydrate-binding protein n=1 Tax=Pseudogemmobacter bohemicus TaxID=2250708 RepID=UPI000DD4D7D7|nr:carbohydrate-binding protein [Pseudogemmobacter bohemicus]
MADPEPGRPAAYWFWSGIPSSQQMHAQLTGFREAGFSRIYIQARPSMPLDLYLSDDYLAAYRAAVEIMAGLGLKAGLYDDYAWTSGQAGGRVVAGADHLRERHLFWAVSDRPEARISGITATLGASLGPAVRDWIHEGGRPVCTDWQLVAAVILWPDGQVEDRTPAARLITAGESGALARLDTLPPGARWIFFAATRIASSRVINYLLPEAGARFVSVGLEPYAQALAGLMPDVVDQLFFDQPAPVLYRWNEAEGNLLNSFLWSEDLAAGLAARGPPGPQLAALLFETGPDTAATRSFVWRLYTRLIGEAFFAPLREFCDRHGLALTGHEILPHVAGFALNGGFSSIDPRVALAADFFGLDRWRDITAVDANNLAPQLAPMLGDSIARASGRRGCLTELYLTAERTETRAAGQWEITPAALRAAMIRLHLLGAGQVILHALYADPGDTSPEPLANMRFDFAPGYNLQPWWGVMRALTDEITALAAFLAAARPQAQVALLYPYETALTEGPRHDHACLFGAWAETLWQLGQPPLILDEAGLARITPGANGPELYGSPLAALVLPGVTALADPDSAARIAALDLPLWRNAPEPGVLRAFLSQTGPVVAPVPGLVTHLAGRDAGGAWRLVLFNESAAPLQSQITLGAGFTLGDAPGVLSALSLYLEPQQLRCLRLSEAGGASTEPRAEPRVEPAPRWHAEALESGWTLQTDGPARPADVTRGWQDQGDADFSGIGIYETTFRLDQPAAPLLELPGLACAARVFVDEEARGPLWHPPFRLALGPLAAGPHRLRLEIANTAANRFYAGTPYAGTLWPDASGLTAPPLLLTPAS